MLTEIEHAAGWWTSQLIKVTVPNAPTPALCEAFKQALCVELSARYRGHWFPEDSQRGCAYRCIAYDHRIDSTLVRAAQSVELQDRIEQLLIHARWHTMFVNPGLVKVQNTKALAAPPTIVYSSSSSSGTAAIDAHATETIGNEKPQSAVPSSSSALKSCVAVPARRSSLQPNLSRTVQFTSPITSSLTPLVETILPSVSLTPSACPAPVAPKRSALKASGHHRSQSTSPLANPLSVRFMSGAVAQLNSEAATFIPKSTSPPPPPAHPKSQSHSPPKSTTPPPATITSLSASLLPPAAIGTATSSTTSTSTSSSVVASVSAKTVSPTSTSTSVRPAVHHSSRSVDLNSALFASLSLNVTPAAAAATPAPVAKAVSPSSAASAAAAALPPKATSTSTSTSPVSLQSAVHHSSRSVDLNSTLFASLSLNHNKPSSPPRGSALPLDAPFPSAIGTDDRLAPLPTVFAHMQTRHKTSHSMFSFPNLSTSPTSSSSPSQLSPCAGTGSASTSPTSALSLPRLVSHHRGLSASLLPTAALYASEVATLRHTLPPQQLVR